jgi:hypothetical protein
MKVLILYNSHPLPEHRIKTLGSWRKLASEVDLMFTFHEGYRRGLWDKVWNKLRLPPDPCDVNGRLLRAQREKNYDLVFVVKGVRIRPGTIQELKTSGARVVFWSNDDMWGWHNRTLWFSRAAKHYDLVVTQKSYNCDPDELPSLGANVFFQDKAYDPALHYPVDATVPSLRHDVVFVGTHEKERRESLLYLADNGVEVDVYGWARPMPDDLHPNLTFHGRHLYGEDYRAVYSGSKICLNFLRRISRDRQTSRSIEIPACRGFMLAERTDEHQRLFVEGQEAEFFSSQTEMLEKTRYYLDHPEERERIARAGYRRCIEGGYSFDERMGEIVERLHDG